MYENKRMQMKYRNRDGLAVYDRFLSDEDMRAYEQLLEREGKISPDHRRRVMATLRKMQGLPAADDTGAFAEALRRLAGEMA